ncbi:S41 family peptidase [Cohnella terricola]|uniref:S41 family peptidase n=1 Tax=Cohnella terricola TaxID=1289167 RepID=A0A559JR17_9BACL|nr:S41 family peptidase [Cohnella terricola]TVY02316.1 S41 family peptidase [Cohnella terricola]
MNFFKKIKASIGILLTFALFFVYVPAALGASAVQTEEVRELLEQYHLSKPADNDLVDKDVEEMVNALHDPYTKYFNEDEWESFNSDLEQTFVGIGIVMAEDKGIVYVDDVIPGSPAASVGILPGDALVSADGKSFKGKSTAEIQSELRGAEGTVVALSVSRNGQTLKFKITRKSVHLPIVTTGMLDKGIGYLALSGFTSDSGKEVKRQLANLEKNGLTSLVLDLRNNGGGYVNAAQEIAGLFIEKGILAHMRDRDGVDQPLEITGSAKPYPVVILVNGNTASASELLSGALRDYGVAKLVGTKTYGKGVVQSLIQMKSGGVLKITIQEYYTPLGKKVDKVGLTPDLVLNGYAQQLIEAYRQAGGRKVSITSGKGGLTVNGIRSAQPGAIRKENNVWYVNLKLAATLVGAQLTYDAKSHTYKLDNGNRKVSIKTNDAQLRILDGQSNVDVKWLKKWFPDLTYSASGDTLKLSIG